jgi:hypothetical protein
MADEDIVQKDEICGRDRTAEGGIVQKTQAAIRP